VISRGTIRNRIENTCIKTTKTIKNLIYILLVFVFVSCQEEATPKPAAYLSLNYQEAEYKTWNNTCPYTFQINSKAKIESPRLKQYCSYNISYPTLKGKIHVTYRAVTNNLEVLLKDAQDLTQEHTIKADGIKSVLYENATQNAYGMVYEVEGNAASPVQFYVTDNKKHFLTGSIYFNTKPNYDSILPAAHYLKKDIQKLMETLTWK